MRTVPSYISQRLKQNIQTRAKHSDPSARIWISRPSTVLLDDRLLERQATMNVSATDVSIAVCHPRKRKANTDIFMAYVSDGTVKVITAKHKTKMDAHIWKDTGFNASGEAVSIAFDGTMPKTYGSEVEFVTEADPWVFWVDSTVLYGKKLYSEENPVVLAEVNCTDVSAIRAMKSDAGGFDFGLVVFFILNGTIHYRQLIDGEWTDAEVVSFGPADVTWQEVAAFRTWDYRVGIQAKTTTGAVYELFTQFMGIGKQNTDHISVDADANFGLKKIKEWFPSNEEHAITVPTIETGAPYGGLYSTLQPKFVEAYNIDEGNGDWGKKMVVVSDVHLRVDEIAANAGSFAIKDSLGREFSAYSAELFEEDGLTIVLSFEDFNAAEGDCLIVYNPGTAITMANTVMEYIESAFTPTNLVKSDIPLPEVEDIWNLDTNGNEVAIRFTEALTVDPAGNEGAFTVTFNEYDKVPEGNLQEKLGVPTGTRAYVSIDETVDLSDGTYSDTVFDGEGLRLRKWTEVDE